MSLARGEALFTVAKDATRPFIVQAGKVDLRAIGTAFNVRLRSEAVEVIVTEGRGSVDDAAKTNTGARRESPPASIITAGKKIILPVRHAATSPADANFDRTRTERTPIAAADIERSLAWKNQKLIFVSASLSDTATEFNRYNHQKLVIADPDLAARKFGGTFDADDPQTMVQLLETSYGVVAEQHGTETVLRLGMAVRGSR